jgi:uncharacterized membrane protein
MPRLRHLRDLKEPRLLLSLLAAGIVSVLLPPWFLLPTRLLCIWDTGMLWFLVSTWVVILRATPKTMRRRAQQQDEGRLMILSLITAAACASLLAIVFMLSGTKDNKSISSGILALHITLSLITILGSWLLVHTIFALHYAHGYYQDDREKGDKAAGLDFPDDIEPDYRDFLYFSFVIGMTSQVSDVQITSRAMRQLALLHGVLSFFFNTAILAMSINIIAGLI